MLRDRHGDRRPTDGQLTAMCGHSLRELAFQKADGQNSAVEPLAKRRSETVDHETNQSLPLESEADLARIALEGADIPQWAR